MILSNVFKIIPKLNLVIFSWKGIATLESWIYFKKKFIAHKDFSLKLKYLDDYCDITFDVSLEDVKKYIEFAVEFEKQSQKTAILTTTPNQVAIASIFKQKKGDKLGKPIIVSTIEKALIYLEIPINQKQEVIDILSAIRNELANQA